MLRTRGYLTGDRGQSLVEIALTLPLLLITLLGMVDVGRAMIYSTAVTNAAREGALLASRTAAPALAVVALRACNETGFNSYNDAVTTPAPSASPAVATCTSGAQVSLSTSPCSTATPTPYPSDSTVTVTYRFSLVSGYLFQPLLGKDSLVATGSACMRSLTQ